MPGIDVPPRQANADALALVGLPSLMALSEGDARIAIGLLDGPVATAHPDLAEARVQAVGERPVAACNDTHSDACGHGTFVAGILAAKRGARAPAICPRCPLLVRPIFGELGATPSAAQMRELARAIVESVAAGARVLNLSVATGEPSTRAEHELRQALDHAASRGVLVVAAAGNNATVGTSVITRHPWVIPVTAHDLHGRPLDRSTLSRAIGTRGLGAPGEGIESLCAAGSSRLAGGTSAAAAFVSGAAALLWSLFPRARARELRYAMTSGTARRAISPPLLDADRASRIIRTYTEIEP
jgi:subtilisin family serine protease